MFKKRVLLLIGIALLIILMAVQVVSAVDQCTFYSDKAVSNSGDTVAITGYCANPGEYAVLTSARCRSGALLSKWESPYGNSVYAMCDDYTMCPPWPGSCVDHHQYVYLDYACCPYDAPTSFVNAYGKTISSPDSDDCTFMINQLARELNIPETSLPASIDCPDVINNQANRDIGWVFPTTYNYQALDCHPEDDDDYGTDDYIGPIREYANDAITASTVSGTGVCTNGLDDDCDGVIDELDECEADVNVDICRDEFYQKTCDWYIGTDTAFQGQACCGDDISYSGSDCGRIISNQVCTDLGWVDSTSLDEEEVGEIFADGCRGQVLLDDSNIYRCQPQLKPRTFNLKIFKEKSEIISRSFDVTVTLLTRLTLLGRLSDFTTLNANSYTISSDNSKVYVTFAASLNEAQTQAKNMNFKTNEANNIRAAVLNIYACYFPDTGDPSTTTFTLNLAKKGSNIFYPHTIYKQVTVYPGLNKLGILSDFTTLDADSYTISGDDPETTIDFYAFNTYTPTIDSNAGDAEIYSSYTPTTTTFTKESVTKDTETHDYVCYEKEPGTDKETRIIAECVGNSQNLDRKDIPFSGATTNEGERAYTGEKRNTSFLLEDNFNGVQSIPSLIVPEDNQHHIKRVDSLRVGDYAVRIPTEGVSEQYARLIYPAIGNINPSEGMIEFWIKPLWNSTTDNQDRVFFNYQATDHHYLRIGKLPQKITFILRDDTTELKSELDIDLVENNWYKIRMGWSSSGITCAVYDIDENLLASDTKSGSVDPVKSPTFTLGMMQGTNSNVANAVFDNLKIYRTFKPMAYYCTDTFQWADDLDNPGNKSTCKAAIDSGLHWTGNYCCGEEVDAPEYYNDPYISTDQPIVDEIGACWASEWMEWGDIPVGTADEGPVINYKGTFESCRADNQILLKKDVSNQQLVHNNPENPQDPNQICPLLIDARAGKDDFYCSMDGNWKKTIPYDTKDATPQSSPATSEESRQPKWDPSNQFRECCGVNDCYNGSDCIKNQRHDASYILFDEHRCLDGNWVRLIPKTTWDRKQKGFCPQATQCLVNPGGNADNNNQPQTYFTAANEAEQPQCINDNQYIKQYYCENGNWSTRTKLIALQLIDLVAQGDYELFCGDFNDILTYVGYKEISDAGAVQAYIKNCHIGTKDVPCANQFCAVKYSKGVAFGTSLNVPVDDSSKSFVKFALGEDLTVCDSAMQNSDDYQLCGNNIYYDQDTNSIIKIPRGRLSQTSTQDLLIKRNFEIQNRFSVLNNFIKPLFDQEEEGGDAKNTLFNSTSLFENIFLVKKGNKDFFAFLEENQGYHIPKGYLEVDQIGLIYNNFIFPGNPCSKEYIGQKTSQETPPPSTCSYSNNNLKFVGIYPIKSGEPTIKELWRGLTSQLRIS